MKYLIANWKMNLTIPEGFKFIEEFISSKLDLAKVKVIVAPSFVSLYPLKLEIENQKISISLCGQDICNEKKGAFTGCVSGDMLKDAGCEYVLVGHSERRLIFNESDEMIYQKFLRSKDSSLTPIVCFGETLLEYKNKNTIPYITKQLAKFKDTPPSFFAYEPVWSIGTGLIPTLDEILTVIKLVKNNFPDSQVFYGGSVTTDNISRIASIRDVDGFLVGGASLLAASFSNLLQSLLQEQNESN